MGAPAHYHPPTDPQHDYELRAPVCVLPSHSPLKTSPASRRVAHVLKLQRRMTAGPREALARAAPAPDLYNPQAMASVGADDLVIDAVGTLCGLGNESSLLFMWVLDPGVSPGFGGGYVPCSSDEFDEGGGG